MLASTSLRLFRFLLSLVVRLSRLPLRAGRTALALRSWSASLWKSILAFGRHQSRIRPHGSDVPVVTNGPTGEHLQVSERARTHLEGTQQHERTLATLPVRPCTIRWEDELLRYQPVRQLRLCEPVPAVPEGGSQRYKPRMANPATEPPDIPAGQETLLSSLPVLPSGWRRHIHPEGIALFYHEGLRVFTERDITVRKDEEELLFCATRLIEKAIATNGVTLDELTEIVLNMDDDRCWHYYFVDHTNRLLFWVDKVDMKVLHVDLQGISRHDHISMSGMLLNIWSRHTTGMLLLVFEYIVHDVKLRSHCEYYPHNRTLPKGVVEDVRGMLNYTMTDMMTTDIDSSSSPFGQDELKAILDLVNSLKDFEEISDQYSVWTIARLMAFFTENQFLNFCGQPCARLNADTPLFGKPDWHRHILFRAINLFLFRAPKEHAVRLQRVWVDGLIIQPRWKDFINRLTAELGRYTIFSTVMLAVNFSFLAVPGVVNTTPGSTAGPIPIIIYCSVVSTVASIIFSFALLNVYSNPRLLVARNVADAMWTLNQSKYGMAHLAITHSLPIASLIWSIAFFSTALAVQIFGPKQAATVATLSVEFFVIVIFVFMGMKAMWLFFKDNGEDATMEMNPSRRGSRHDVEKGSRN